MTDQLSTILTETAKAGPWAVTAGALIWFLQRDIKTNLDKIVDQLHLLVLAHTSETGSKEKVDTALRDIHSKLDIVNSKLDELLFKTKDK